MKQLFFFLLLSCRVSAQKGMEPMIAAEINFANQSIKYGAKTAFLNHLDSLGIVFSNNLPVNGLAFWMAKDAGGPELSWTPEFAEISSSLDFGYTTGPWKIRKAPGEEPSAWGQYTTVWHLDQKGEWKFLVDLGNNNRPSWNDIQVKSIQVQKLSTDTFQLDNMLKSEQAFIKSCLKDKKGAYREFLSGQSILNRNNSRPALTGTDKEMAIEALGNKPLFEVLGSGMAPGNDLGYVFGTSALNGKRDNYLRIWRRESSGWKIALEVTRQ